MYTARLEQLGVRTESRIQTTRLKERLLSALPDLKAYTKGRDLLLIFEDAVGALEKACGENQDNDALHLARVVRKEMFSGKFTFSAHS